MSSDVGKIVTFSFKKEDFIYSEMLEAISMFYESRNERDKANISKFITDLIKARVPKIVEDIKNRYGVDVLDVYREYKRRNVTAKDFFMSKTKRDTESDKFLQEKLKESYGE
jgi:hypothetical protein